MKSTFAIIITLFVSFNTIGANNNLIFGDNNVVVATYKGTTDDGEYKFIDADKKVILFTVIGEEVEVDLSDDANLNVKYSITWIEAKSEVYDDEGEPTGKTVAVKQIVKLVRSK